MGQLLVREPRPWEVHAHDIVLQCAEVRPAVQCTELALHCMAVLLLLPGAAALQATALNLALDGLASQGSYSNISLHKMVYWWI